MSILSTFKKCKSLITFSCLLIAYCLVKSADLVEIEENVTVDSTEELVCESKSQTFPILVVGVLSSVVFSCVGILPALFIRTDADEEKFSNYKFYNTL